MKQINVKNQMVTMTLIIIGLSFVIGFLVILPTIKNIRQLQSDINNTQQFLEDQYEKTQRMRRSVHNLNEILSQVEKFKNVSATNGPELEIITQLERLATTYNVSQTLRATLQKNKNTPVMNNLPALLKNKDYYTFSFQSEGEYKNLINYLKSIEELPYYFSINSIQLSKPINSNKASLKFEAILFILNNEK